MSAGITDVTAANWEAEVAQSALPVLVDFWAVWCGPCKAITPVLQELSTELAGKLKIVKVNVDEAPELAGKYDVRAIPTLIVLKNGEKTFSHTGVLPKSALLAKLTPVIG